MPLTSTLIIITGDFLPRARVGYSSLSSLIHHLSKALSHQGVDVGPNLVGNLFKKTFQNPNFTTWAPEVSIDGRSSKENTQTLWRHWPGYKRKKIICRKKESKSFMVVVPPLQLMSGAQCWRCLGSLRSPSCSTSQLPSSCCSTRETLAKVGTSISSGRAEVSAQEAKA